MYFFMVNFDFTINDCLLYFDNQVIVKTFGV